jgi:hypothetical protein
VIGATVASETNSMHNTSMPPNSRVCPPRATRVLASGAGSGWLIAPRPWERLDGDANLALTLRNPPIYLGHPRLIQVTAPREDP